MMRPRRMKHIELTVLNRDVDPVIEYLGRRGLMQFSPGILAGASGTDTGKDNTENAALIRENLNRLSSAGVYLGVDIPGEPEEDSVLPREEEEHLTSKITAAVLALGAAEHEQGVEKQKLEETFNEARAFSRLNAPFSDLDQLSYLTLRIGRLDTSREEALRDNLADRAVIIPLDDSGRVLAAASRKGRFALDSELKKSAFTPISVPQGYKGIPSELLAGLEKRMTEVDKELERIEEKKNICRKEYGPAIWKLTASYLMAQAVETLKQRLRGTKNVFVISGWVPADEVSDFVKELGRLTGGRTAVRSYNPEEMGKAGEREKVPVSLKHGAFVRGFEPLVFSYGAPLYGTLDPTPFAAVFFTLLFGIMFGDMGQGLVLLLLGFAAGARGKHKINLLSAFPHFSTPLKAVGITSMIMGFLTGEFFANEEILVKPTRAVLGFFMGLFGIAGEAPERILHLMPDAGSFTKVFYFFGFTIAVGVIVNSLGLVMNVSNRCARKNYEAAFCSKTGLPGLLFLWYALFIAVRIMLGGNFARLDFAGLCIPMGIIFFAPALWRAFSGRRPVLEHGLFLFLMEGFLELLELLSSSVSNTISFLRVGAFALSHAVLSFIIIAFSHMVRGTAAGPLASAAIVVFGNLVIIVLEGMIVAIQVVRLHYYEFFNKFYTETGTAFAPFRFRKAK